MSIILSLFALLPASTVSEVWSSNRKYIWINSVTDWSTAESHCNTQYGTFLASIHSSSDNTEISAVCSNSVENACYIGFNDQTTEDTFLWSDGSTVGDYDPPSFSRSNTDHGGYDEDCVIIYVDETWSDTPCHTSHPYSFICNAPQQVSSVNGKYIWINIITDWSTAESHCNTQYGTSLASIHSSSDNTEISNLCSISAENACYIGFNDQTTEGTFLWSDGSAVGDYDPPSFPHENTDHGGYDEDCVIVFYDGTWADTPCHTSHPYSFICNAPTLDPTAAPSYNPSENPTEYPTANPTKYPTGNPSKIPSENPSKYPTKYPTENLTKYPTANPSNIPSESPNYTENPTKYPTEIPSNIPSNVPSENPSTIPTQSPSILPTETPVLVSEGPTRTPNTSEGSTNAYSTTPLDFADYPDSVVILSWISSILICFVMLILC